MSLTARLRYAYVTLQKERSFCDFSEINVPNLTRLSRTFYSSKSNQHIIFRSLNFDWETKLGIHRYIQRQCLMSGSSFTEYFCDTVLQKYNLKNGHNVKHNSKMLTWNLRNISARRLCYGHRLRWWQNKQRTKILIQNEQVGWGR